MVFSFPLGLLYLHGQVQQVQGAMLKCFYVMGPVMKAQIYDVLIKGKVLKGAVSDEGNLNK